MLRRFRPLRAAAALAAAMTLVGCGGAAAPASPAGSQPAAGQLHHLDFLQGYIPSSEYSYFVVADKKGYYKSAGIDFTQHPGSGSANTVKIVGAGQYPVGMADAGVILPAIASGEPIEAVMAFYNATPTAVISLAGSGVNSLSDLVGKRVGSEATSSVTFMWKAAMVKAGVPIDKVQFETLDSSAKVPSLLEGKVDAILGGPPQPPQIEAQGKQVDFLPLYKVLNVLADCIFVNKNWVQQPGNAAILRSFLKATQQGLAYTKDHVDEAVSLTNAAYPTLSKSVLQGEMKLEEPLIWTPTAEKQGLGTMSADQWQALQTILVDAKIQSKPIDVSAAFTNQYLPGGGS